MAVTPTGRKRKRSTSAGASVTTSGRQPQRSLITRWAWRLAWLLACCLVLSILAVGALRWVNPPTSAFMLQHWLTQRLAGEASPALHYQWTDWDAIAAPLKLAVIAAEDQRFPSHHGFDLVELQDAWNSFREGGRLRGASTISQQTAKNLFLWGGRDYMRKLFEAWFTLLLETWLPKTRILELYLNIAQFSPDTFGVGAASWRYFDRPAIAISPAQAARLAAVLPNPMLYRLDEASSARVQRRMRWIRQQMKQLGGTRYLDRLPD
ncbi:monofunctional biosynthetic peptidoglycan transglycosylase [Rhabdochromatium marinum]|uniref:monofunctional biosynthetic peptidoglycan transglycosylase n=1 Tax=Rhabdochromatium marinum TaxID=48729 RepID=UPI0019067F69|nr:monofunctional biosynthetic peptidoglycan transglycosylase [Rhabdochromatium marinum]MBK1648188.1 monofunctional biosynthetic peptidoglycan transglycosylase [Rhabdochromatium marinum]